MFCGLSQKCKCGFLYINRVHHYIRVLLILHGLVLLPDAASQAQEMKKCNEGAIGRKVCSIPGRLECHSLMVWACCLQL